MVVGRTHLHELSGSLAEDLVSLAGEVEIVPARASECNVVAMKEFHSPEEVVAGFLANLLLHTQFLDRVLVLRLRVDQSPAWGGDVAELGSPLADARGVGKLLGRNLALHELVGLEQEDVTAHPVLGMALEPLVPIGSEFDGHAVAGGVDISAGLKLEARKMGDIDGLGKNDQDGCLHPGVDDVQLAEEVLDAPVNGEETLGALELGVVENVVDTEPNGEQSPLLGRLDGPHALEPLHLHEVADLLLEVAQSEVGEVVRGGGVLEDGIVKDGANGVGVILGDLGRQRAGIVVYRVAENLRVRSESAGVFTGCDVWWCQGGFAINVPLDTGPLAKQDRWRDV